MKRVAEIGEFGLIERITKLLPQTADVLVGPGDDAAVLELSSGQILVATCDMAIEGIHFDLGLCRPEQVGRRAMTANLSDIAAMGCKPLFAIVSVGLPQDTVVRCVEEICRGMGRAAQEHSVALVGGDTVRSPDKMVIDIALIGEPADSKYLTRSGARDGDAIVVTGFPGQSAAGLEILLSGKEAKGTGEEELVQAHLEPRARIEQGLHLAQNGSVGAAIDLSDGLAQDLGHICEMSRLGAVIDVEELPISPQLAEYCEESDRPAAELCLCGGEDYELLFTLPQDAVEPFFVEWARKFDLPATVVGHLTSEFDGVHLNNPKGIPLPDMSGHNHFS